MRALSNPPTLTNCKRLADLRDTTPESLGAERTGAICTPPPWGSLVGLLILEIELPEKSEPARAYCMLAPALPTRS